MTDLEFAFTLFRAIIAALFLGLGTATLIHWRERLAKATPAEGRLWALGTVGVLFYAIALVLWGR